MAEVIQSLSICCPSATGRCINHCETCTARQHENPYPDKFHGTHVENFEYWQNVIRRMRDAQKKGCTTVMLTGSNEPQQERRWIEGLYMAMQSLPEPFANIEIQTTGAFLNEDYLQFLKAFGVTTVAVSSFNIYNDDVNRKIEHNADKNLNLQHLCDMVEALGMNVRICINVTDYLLTIEQASHLASMSYNTQDVMYDVVEQLLKRCRELHANQVTFRKMWSAPGTVEEAWIKKHGVWSELLLSTVNRVIEERGKLINILPYGAARYDYLGFSIVIDRDSMSQNELNTATKYYIIRENGKMYSNWETPASIVF